MSAAPAPAAPVSAVSSEEVRALAQRAAAELQIPLEQVNLLRLAHWLHEQSGGGRAVLR